MLVSRWMRTAVPGIANLATTSLGIASLGIMVAAVVAPAVAQPYDYGTPSSPPPLPPSYEPAPPRYAPPPPAYEPPPGSRCEASFPGEYHRRRFVCPMRVAKPVGAACRCVAPPPPGYPPGPVAHGRVIP
jgi:hypothetical protein